MNKHFSHRNNTSVASLANTVERTAGFKIITQTERTVIYIGDYQPFLFFAEQSNDGWTYHYRIPLDTLLG